MGYCVRRFFAARVVIRVTLPARNPVRYARAPRLRADLAEPGSLLGREIAAAER
jgi:hypothetical protein